MLFLRLAARNARRNLNRSALAVLGMALAAGIVTGSLSMQSGYPRHAFWEYRKFAGADIVVYADDIAFSLRPGAQLTWQLSPESCRNDLEVYFPPRAGGGYLAAAPGPALDLQELPGPLRDLAPAALQPYLSLPAVVVAPGRPPLPAVLRGRDPHADASTWGLGSLLAAGGRDLVCLLNHSPPQGWPEAAATTTITVEVPAVIAHGRDGTRYDYTRRRRYDLEVVGTYSIVTATTLSETTDGPPATQYEYLTTDHIFIPQATWRELFAQASGGTEHRYTHQLGITVPSMFHARDLARSLQRALPGHTVLTVPELVGAARRELGQVLVPADTAHVLTGLAFALAGALVTANMLVLVSQRRRELAVLKAIGASGWDLAVMVLGEALSLAGLGSMLGFAVVQGFFLLVYLTCEVSLARVGLSALTTAARVTALTTVTAGVAALVPAMEATAATTVEVLRHD